MSGKNGRTKSSIRNPAILAVCESCGCRPRRATTWGAELAREGAPECTAVEQRGKGNEGTTRSVLLRKPTVKGSRRAQQRTASGRPRRALFDHGAASHPDPGGHAQVEMTTTILKHTTKSKSGHPRLAFAVPAVRKRSRCMSDHFFKVHARAAVRGTAQIARQRLQKRGVHRRATGQDAVERMQAEPAVARKMSARSGSKRSAGTLAIRTTHQITQFRLNVISAPSARALTDRAWLTIADH